MNSKLFQFLVNLILILSWQIPVNAQSETILEEIDRTGLLKVGIREDAVPFGYRDLNNNLAGVCLDFIYVLRERVKERLNKEVILVKLYKSTLFNRFELVSDGIIYLECGPNTIRQVSDYKITFSTSFFLTGTQFLINKNNQKNINPNSNLANINIGVLANTSNQQLIEAKYPSANLVEFQGITGRFRGIQALQGEKVDAFASDSILLIGEAILQGLNFGRDYILVPKVPLDCEEYGLIIPDDDLQWKKFVNSVVKDAQSRKTFKKWFGEVLPEIEAIENFCHSQINQNQE